MHLGWTRGLRRGYHPAVMFRWMLPLGLIALTPACSDSTPAPPPRSDAGADVGADVNGVSDVATDDAPDVAGDDVPVAPSCVADGAVPTVVPGHCTGAVNDPGLLRANSMEMTALVIPGGQRVAPAPNRLRLDGFPMAMLRLPGTQKVVVTDGGINTERLRVIDLSTPTPTVVPGSVVEFSRDGSTQQPSLFYGLAYDSGHHRLFASGGGGNRVYAFTVSDAGALTADLAHTIDLHVAEHPTMGLPPFVSGIALSADATRLFVSYELGGVLSIRDAETGMEIHRVPFESTAAGADLPNPYAVVTRPGDDRHVYVSLWGTQQVAEVDTTMGVVSRLWSVGKNPEGLLFTPDGTQLYVAASDSDDVATIDLTTPMGTVARHYLGGSMSAPRGISPSALSWGRTGSSPDRRLYVVEAADNAVEVLDPVTFTRVGRIPTEWYPTDVEVLDDGSPVVLTGKGVGLGPNNHPDTTGILDLMGGSIARFAPQTDTQLAMGHTVATANLEAPRGFGRVDCPAGAPYDFPVPQPGAGPSTKIHHVILVVRENKTYDALLGDLPGGYGDPNLTILPHDQMDRVFPNFRGLVRTFSGGDNFYSGAEQSLQGHAWTSLGRTTDFNERAWLTTWGRAQRSPPAVSTTDIGIPEEGSIFDAMANAHVTMQNWGEIVANARFAVPLTRYGSFPQDLTYPDIHRAQNFSDAITNCELAPFTYIVLPNDHTYGGRPGSTTPESMYEDNDEGTGLLIDTVSHSTYWQDTLVIVIEDDPQDGGDRVDNHRSVVLMASPWVRRGYFSHGHYDNASVHHTIEQILGVPPHNRTVGIASTMYDFFTSTPDYTPYTYTPRHDAVTHNPMTGMYAEESARMDWSQIDNQPGLSRLIWRMTHHGATPPWAEIHEVDPDGDGD